MLTREEYRTTVATYFRVGAEQAFVGRDARDYIMPRHEDIDVSYSIGDDGASIVVKDRDGLVFTGDSDDPSDLPRLAMEAGSAYARGRSLPRHRSRAHLACLILSWFVVGLVVAGFLFSGR